MTELFDRVDPERKLNAYGQEIDALNHWRQAGILINR